jgi:uncharacterized protein (DUF1800 family)
MPYSLPNPHLATPGFLRSLLCLLLLVLLTLPPGLPAQSPMAPPATSAIPAEHLRTGKLRGDDRLLQVLNRFTYGPRPGDLEHIRALGLQAWFNEQLNPGKIDDSALDRRLADYPAMQLPISQLLARYPDQQVIRKVMSGQQARPSGEAEKAIYNNQIARTEEKKDQQAAQKQTAQNQSTQNQPTPSQPTQPIPAAPPVPLPFDPQALLDKPAAARFAALCKLSVPQLDALRTALRPIDRARLIDGFTPPQLETVAALRAPAQVVAAELLQTKLLRDIYSERQLNEVMTDFWLNHFSVYLHKSEDAPYYIAGFERDTIRPHALGSFEALLVAVASSPAMLDYLDNSSSVGPNSIFAQRPFHGGPNQKKPDGLNENYGRELMELHTLGVNGGYTQRDVTEVAKVFTGWTVGSPEHNGVPTQAQYDPRKHEPGTKTVLGTKIKDSGEREGLEVLHLLATRPSTARFISTKLAVRFVGDDPPPALIDRMTKAFLATHGDIRHVLLAMVNAPEFFSASTYRDKIKTPQDFVVSAIRASGANVESTGALVNVVDELGMPLYGMQTPNGYSMKADAWNNTASLVARLNFALALAANRVAGVHTDWSPMLGPAPDSDPNAEPGTLPPAAKEALLEANLLHIRVSDKTRATILAQIDTDPRQQEASLRQVAIEARKRDPLALDRPGPPGSFPRNSDGTPNFDTQAALAAGLLFGSPEFQRR